MFDEFTLAVNLGRRYFSSKIFYVKRHHMRIPKFDFVVFRLSVRVVVPVKEHPKFNFVGKLLGPKGNSMKRLQEDTMTKMAVLGKGSMRNKQQVPYILRISTQFTNYKPGFFLSFFHRLW